MRKQEQIGTFEVKGDRVIVSDPCYLRHNSHEISLPALPGKWIAGVEMDGGRVAMLLARHESHIPGMNWERFPKVAPVDSGQMSINCERVAVTLVEPLDSFNYYNECMDRTCGTSNYGTFDGTAVSSSGWGDGCYAVHFQKNGNDKAVAIKITFIEEEVRENCSRCCASFPEDELNHDGECPDCQPYGYCSMCSDEIRETGYHWESFEMCEDCFNENICPQCEAELEDGECPECGQEM